ncbi:TolC family outer membrane protein [Paucibacter sp. KCTC 42545]|uniref:TolC family outer membrane protein n=1 Tax=Paucibacter sp. KCTC 42545 TaxID=1768242 RepID=UPI000733C472|nr:TolC family outer membrane protein [Paucibacter sp. KCTC 42545]ALT76899.1 channel protein TolC [Paucibacter sp. KCTC 42545]
MSDRRAIQSRFTPLNRLGLALLLAFGSAAGAQAQSLQELYDAARGFDASYLSARAQADSAQYKAAQAEALARPTLGVGVGPSVQRTEPINGVNYNSLVVQGSLQGKYALYNPANARTIEQAKRGLSVAAADLEAAEQDLIVRMAQAYFDVLAAKDALGTAKASKAAIAEQLASAKRNFEVGTATITDTRETQARYDLATATELAADNDLRVKGVTLDQLVGRVGVVPKPLAVPVALPAVMPVNVEPWVSQADELHPAIRKAKLGLEVATLETAKARAVDGVTVDMSGAINVQNSNNSLKDATAARAFGEGTTRSANVGLSINYPLYSGGANQNRIKETLALEEKSRNDLDFARRSVSEGTKRAFFGVQSLSAQVKAYEAAESSSKLALEATQLGYKVGVRVNLDVLNAQFQLFTTQRDLAKARYDVIVNGLKLRQASGQLSAADISSVNQLLAK